MSLAEANPSPLGMRKIHGKPTAMMNAASAAHHQFEMSKHEPLKAENRKK